MQWDILVDASTDMRKLYWYCVVLCVCSATTGYDGSLMNT